MLAIAREKAKGVENIDFVEGKASDLSRFSERSFDLVLNLDGAISFSGFHALKAIQERTCHCACEMSNSMRPLQVAVRISHIVLLLLTCGVLSAQNQEHRVRNIVPVHGAWADGSGWKGVYEILVKDGYNVSVVQEPETSFGDFIQTCTKCINCA
jgi:hypothetical protein